MSESFYGRIADRFTQGYALGQRMEQDYLRRQERDAYGEMADAEAEAEKARQAIPAGGTPEYMGTVGQPQQALDLNKGVSTELGGSMDAKTGVAAPMSQAVPEGGGFGQNVQTDPKYFDAVRAARAKYLKSVGSNDPGRALMLKKYFEENDQQEIVDNLYKASALAASGDQMGAARHALHAYGMIDDGGGAQVRMVNGHLVGIGFDQQTGEMRNVLSLDSESLFKMATQLKDPMAYRQLVREEKADKMAEEKHGWERELFPEQKKAAENQNALVAKQLEHYDQMFEQSMAREGAMTQAAQAQSLYYLSKALGLDATSMANAGFKNPAQYMEFTKKLNDETRTVLDNMAGDKSVEGAWAAEGGERNVARVQSKANELMLLSIKSGSPLQPSAAIQAALRLNTFSDILTGKFQSPDADIDTYAKEHNINAGWNEKTNTLQLDIDGTPVNVPMRKGDPVYEYVVKKAQEVEKDPNASAEEKADARGLLSRLGGGIGRTARAYTESVPGGIPFSGDVEPRGMFGGETLGGIAEGVQSGWTDLTEGIRTGYGE